MVVLARDPPVRHILGGQGQLEGFREVRVRDDVVTQAVQEVHTLEDPPRTLLRQSIHADLYHLCGGREGEK